MGFKSILINLFIIYWPFIASYIVWQIYKPYKKPYNTVLEMMFFWPWIYGKYPNKKTK